MRRVVADAVGIEFGLSIQIPCQQEKLRGNFPDSCPEWRRSHPTQSNRELFAGIREFILRERGPRFVNREHGG
jgi:hypothetical protein